jgi:hypothetical protein
MIYINKVHKRELVLATFLVFTALVLVACGGAATSETTQAPQVLEQTEEAPVPEEPTTAPTEPESAREGVLRVAMQPIVQTDPAFISFPQTVKCWWPTMYTIIWLMLTPIL